MKDLISSKESCRIVIQNVRKINESTKTVIIVKEMNIDIVILEIVEC